MANGLSYNKKRSRLNCVCSVFERDIYENTTELLFLPVFYFHFRFKSFFNLFYFIVTPFTLCKVGERGRNQHCSVVCNESPHKDCRLDFAYCTDFEE